jgi:hypothetical protein
VIINGIYLDELKILDFQQPQASGKPYTDSFKTKFFGTTVIATIDNVVPTKTLKEVNFIIYLTGMFYFCFFIILSHVKYVIGESVDFTKAYYGTNYVLKCAIVSMCPDLNKSSIVPTANRLLQHKKPRIIYKYI